MSDLLHSYSYLSLTATDSSIESHIHVMNDAGASTNQDDDTVSMAILFYINIASPTYKSDRQLAGKNRMQLIGKC